ncbi:MAG: Asp-tRNA(Asn)/Glu-tRNA(Gln) amidotransferase subunit GatA, partial [Proteobacteria bacterium]|nr:Asp-tRNA(Asn)/Glu-tRNA(Gln) amidotransferase subunit GatA [Pseudomonadota bacterium]
MEAFKSLRALRRELDQGVYTSSDLTRWCLDQIEAANPTLNSFITLCAEPALAAAAAADVLIKQGNAQPLTGIPLAHKDIFCTDGVLTTCGSKILANFVAPYDATVVTRLNNAGMVTVGKTNMDEFAMGSSNENSAYGAVANPWQIDRVPGGSSGGSAAAVAAGLIPVATGTDTGGSIRQPAAFCGLTGLKPTYGRVSRYGMVAFASSLDQGGVLGNSVEDVALVVSAMAGFDPRDSTSSEHIDEWLSGFTADHLANPVGPRTIGLPAEYFDPLNEGAELLAQAARLLESQGHKIVDISLPHTSAAIPAYYIIAGAEASTNLSRYDGVRFGHRAENPQDLDDLYRRSRSEGFGTEVKRRILTGTYALSVGYFDAYYLKAQKIRRLIQNDFLAAFDKVDLILAPTTPGVAFKRNELTADPVAMYQQDPFTVPVSLAG